MYRFSYAEIAEDSSSECRRRERELFEKVIQRMNAVQGAPAQSPEMLDAVLLVQRLWMFLINDLSHADNGLPDKLKAGLISIGFWVMRETDRIVQGEHNNLAALIDVNTMIKEGLK